MVWLLVLPRMSLYLDDFSGLVDSDLPGGTSVFTYLNLRFVSVRLEVAGYNFIR